MAPQQTEQRSVAASYTPEFDRRTLSKLDRWIERTIAFAAVAGLLMGALAFFGGKVAGPGRMIVDLRQDTDANTHRIVRLEILADSLMRGQRTTNYISCAIYRDRFPRTPKPEGCP